MSGVAVAFRPCLDGLALVLELGALLVQVSWKSLESCELVLIIVELFHNVKGVNVEEIHERLRAELESRGYTKPVMAARAAGLENSQGLRDVLAGRKRLSTELLACSPRGAA